MKNTPKRSVGAALVESCLVMAMLCLILFGILQVSYLVAARDVISYTAVAASRSASVGFNDFMIFKATRVISIPTAGPIITPQVSGGGSPAGSTGGQMWDTAVRDVPYSEQYWQERYLIPFYLGAEEWNELDAILDYENWHDIDVRINSNLLGAPDDNMVEVNVYQYVPMVFPFARAFYRGNMAQVSRSNGDIADEVPRVFMKESVRMENHSALYMEEGTAP